MQKTSFLSGFKNKRNLLIFSIFFVFVGLLLFTVYGVNSFSLVSFTPEENSSVTPESANISFSFNKELALDGGDLFTVRINPMIDFAAHIEGNILFIDTYDYLFIDAVEYHVVIENIESTNGEVLSVANSFTVNLTKNALSFVDTLPVNNSGYSIVLMDDYVFITPQSVSYDSGLSQAYGYLKKYGISPEVYRVVVEPNWSIVAPTLYDQYIPPGE